MTGDAYIVQGDALDLPLPDDSVDVVITSPPYFQLRSYQDGGEHYDGQLGSEATPTAFVDALIAATAEMRRVIKPSGSLFINLGDKYGDADSGHPKSLLGIPARYAIRCVDDLGLVWRAEIAWSKLNGLPESATDRVRRSHEVFLHFTKQPTYFSAVDDIREPFVHASDDPRGRVPGSVWTILLEPLQVPAWAKDRYGLTEHYAAFPQEWPRRLITGWCPAGICMQCGEGRRPIRYAVGRYACACTPYTDYPERRGTSWHDHPGPSNADPRGNFITENQTRKPVREYDLAAWTPPPTRPAVVLDPFGGTGTVAMVARVMGRTGISVDLSHDYSRFARWRVFESGHSTKSIKRIAGEAQGALL